MSVSGVQENIIYSIVKGMEPATHTVPLTRCTERKKGGKDQESIQSSTTPNPGYHMGNLQKTQLNITNKSQEVSPFLASDHKVAMNDAKASQTQDINTTNDPQTKYRIGMVSKIFCWRA